MIQSKKKALKEAFNALKEAFNALKEAFNALVWKVSTKSD
jgi:hypothetical protein